MTFGSIQILFSNMSHGFENLHDMFVPCRNISLVINTGLVVQSNVSLTTSLRRQFVKYMPTTFSNPLLFLLKKCENLLQCTVVFC